MCPVNPNCFDCGNRANFDFSEWWLRVQTDRHTHVAFSRSQKSGQVENGPMLPLVAISNTAMQPGIADIGASPQLFYTLRSDMRTKREFAARAPITAC